MKKVLVIGASGTIGIPTIKYLLSEGKYEITALDLRNKNSKKRLKKYRRRINIVYADMNDSILMDSLVKNQDVVIHLAGAIPPLSDIKKTIGEKVDYQGTKTIVNALNNYNPDCFLVYASSTTIYGDVKVASVKSEANITDLDYYSNTKLKVEEFIKKHVKNYTIFRLPLVLSNPNCKTFMYHVPKKRIVEAITDQDAGYCFASSVEHMSELKKKIFNVTGGEMLRDQYENILANFLEIYGISFRYLLSKIFIDKNFYVHVYKDSDKLEEILKFRNDSLSSYYMRCKRQVKGRWVAKLLAKPIVYRLKRKIKN